MLALRNRIRIVTSAERDRPPAAQWIIHSIRFPYIRSDQKSAILCDICLVVDTCARICVHTSCRNSKQFHAEEIVSNSTSPINNPSLTYLSSFQQFYSSHGEGQAPTLPNAT
ncbi:hypothetical protein TcasGA2_TC003926 [Tribolium castaneum]|uniref:Uncharacterized protein n=1 Tax=Tribolium castaneum TaxID=7070 RepID=D6WHN5_TRICA|nr:hypothetical protein TcasGA2_TC003926 [Tribolium castaneum]